MKARPQILKLMIPLLFIFSLSAQAESVEMPEATSRDVVEMPSQASKPFWQALSEAIDRKDFRQAKILLDRADLNALSPDARSAIKTLQILLEDRLSAQVRPRPPMQPPKLEPKTGLPYGAFSRKTNERISRSTFESLDHMSTLFTQGITAGISLLNTEIFDGTDEEAFIIPAASGTAYALFGAFTLSSNRISRGDIPLIDGLAVYVPTHTLLLTNSIFWDEIDWDIYPWLFSGASIASLPLAYFLSQRYDPDPGDAQLIRDSLFWGGLYGWGLYFALHPDDSPGFGRGFPITVLTSSIAAGTIGYWLARDTEYSLERIRASTLGGYFGGVVGGLLAVAMQTDNVRATSMLMMLSSGLGVMIGFGSTEHLDQIPEGAAVVGTETTELQISPGPLVITDSKGQPSIRAGLILRGRF